MIIVTAIVETSGKLSREKKAKTFQYSTRQQEECVRYVYKYRVTR